MKQQRNAPLRNLVKKHIEVRMEDKEIIKKYLESIKFSVNKSYIDLILNYVKFKDNYIKTLNLVNIPSKVLKDVEPTKKEEVKK